MTRDHVDPHFGIPFSTATAAISAVPGAWRRPFQPRAPQLAIRSGGRTWLGRTIDAALGWHERARERRQLTALDQHLLDDVGISRAAAAREAAKPFWRA